MRFWMVILVLLILSAGTSHQNRHKKQSDWESKINPEKIGNLENTDINEIDNRGEILRVESDASVLRTRARLREKFVRLLSSVVGEIIQRGRSKGAEGVTKKIAALPPDVTGPSGPPATRGGFDYKTVITRNNGTRGNGPIAEDGKLLSETLLGGPSTFEGVGQKYRKSRQPRATNRTLGEERTRRQLVGQSAMQVNQPDAWIRKDIAMDDGDNLKMHVLVVKDEEIPDCCSVAKQVTNQRYFMCSGALLTLKHAITSASCVHYADIYERHVEAELAVLVGAAEPRSYVIKINRYEMHPDYEYDVDSRNHAANNIAVLFLACGVVSQDVVLPSFPKGTNDDVAHMCCRGRCDLITVIENSYNRHIARSVQAKHLPAPRHDDEANYDPQSLNAALAALQFLDNRPAFPTHLLPPGLRKSRSPKKLAAAPSFFGKETRGSSQKQRGSSGKRKKGKSAKSPKNEGPRKAKLVLKLEDLFGQRRSLSSFLPVMRALGEAGVDVEELLAKIDWQKVEETMDKKLPEGPTREKVDLFARNVVDETMRRLEKVLEDVEGGGREGNGGSVFEKLMPNDSRNNMIENFVHVFTKVVSSLVPPNNAGASFPISLDGSLEEKDLKDPPPSNQECPPLGTPVFADKTLVGLVVYTCDDVQPWVEWKYASIARNMNWIRREINTRQHDGVVTCAGPESPARSKRTESVVESEKPTEIREGKFERKANGEKRSEGEGRGVGGPIRNLEDARYSALGTYPRIPKDPWFARNSPPAPRLQRADEQRRIFPDSPKEPTSLPRDFPAYNANTCYVKPDGSVDCRERGNAEIR